MIENLYGSLIWLLIILARGGQSLQCWTCSSIFEPGCDDPFQPLDLTRDAEYFLYDCNRDAIMNGSLEEQHLMKHVFGQEAKTFCKKTVLESYGITIVYRGCSFGVITEDCSGGRENVECHSTACFTDGCNSTTGLSRVSSLCIAITIFILLFSYLNQV